VVLGQTVHVSGSTLFDGNIQPASITTLQVATLSRSAASPTRPVKSSHHASSWKLAGSALAVKGIVQSLDMLRIRSMWNTLTVDYSAITPMGSLANGVTVKVSGTMLNAAGALVATRVDVLQGFGGRRTNRGDRGPYHTFTSNSIS